MSIFTFARATFTSGTGTADGANLTANGFLAVQGGTTTQMIFVDEVYIGGQAASTAPQIFLLGRDSTVGATLSPLISPDTIGMNHPSGGVLTSVPSAFINATTLPQRSASLTQPKKNFTFNAFGGLVRANYANTLDRFGILGNTSSLGEFSLSNFTGSTTASLGGHIIMEVV